MQTTQVKISYLGEEIEYELLWLEEFKRGNSGSMPRAAYLHQRKFTQGKGWRASWDTEKAYYRRLTDIMRDFDSGLGERLKDVDAVVGPPSSTRLYAPYISLAESRFNAHDLTPYFAPDGTLDAARLAADYPSPPRHVLIIDDVYASGDAARDTIGPLRKVWPNARWTVAVVIRSM